MSLWHKEVGVQTERFKKLPSEKILTFTVGCLDHAFAANHPSFSTAIEPARLEMALTTLDQLWSCIQNHEIPTTFESLLANIESIMPSEDEFDSLVSGWYYTLTALECIIRGTTDDNRLQLAIEATYAAYNSICDNELQKAVKETGGGLCGEEITEAERASIICREEIAFQLQCLTAVENGIPIVRFSVDKRGEAK